MRGFLNTIKIDMKICDSFFGQVSCQLKVNRLQTYSAASGSCSVLNSAKEPEDCRHL